MDRPDFLMTGVGPGTTNKKQYEQNHVRHAAIVLPLRYPDGSTALAVQCYYNLQKSTGNVISSKLLPEPPLTERAVQYAKDKGFCKGQGADYKDVIKTQEDRLRGK